MDFMTHIGTGALLATAFDSPELQIACIVGSALPDITLLPIYFSIVRKHKNWRVWEYFQEDGKDIISPALLKYYHYSHSLTFVFLLLVLSFVFSVPQLQALSLGALSHILWDFPTHTGMWAIPLFAPFSGWRTQRFTNWWGKEKSKLFMVSLWVLIGGTYWFIR